MALAKQGHRRFAIVAGPKDEITSRDRVDGFLRGLAEAGREEPDLVHGTFDRAGGETALGQLVERGAVPGVDVVAAMSDAMAVGVVSELRRRAISGVVVSGYDGIPFVRALLPGLSGVVVPLHEMGRASVAMALDGGDSVVFEAAVYVGD